MNEKKVQRCIASLIAILSCFYLAMAITYNLDKTFTQLYEYTLSPIKLISIFSQMRTLQLFGIIFLSLLMIFGILLYIAFATSFSNKSKHITPQISIPEKSGHNEYGSAEWLKTKDYDKAFYNVEIDEKNDTIKFLLENGENDLKDNYEIEVMDNPVLEYGGIICGSKKEKSKKTYFVGTDTHSIVFGATRSGKTRTVTLKSVCLQALAGESMITLDPKGEMYLYTMFYLQRLGYEVIAIDFKDLQKSMHYNFLQQIIDCVNNDNINKAIEYARDMTTELVANTQRGEPIWTNGERSVLTCAIVSVVWDNRERPEYQNMTNVYFFIARMCKSDKNGITPLMMYLKSLNGVFHPATLTIDVAELAPDKMRASFYSSALTTLNLFSDPNIYGMSNCTDFDIYETGNKKRAIFIILPDEKKTYHSIASLFVAQQYQVLKEQSNKYGNRLPKRVNFNLEEFGNCPAFTNVQSMFSVGGGAGMRFNIIIQSTSQLIDVYDKDVAQIIMDNCENWIYLQSDNEDTLKTLSNRLGQYTIRSPSASSSLNGDLSCSYSLTGRNLLNTDEIKKLRRPWQLVTTRYPPVVLYSADIAKTIFNKMLGLGNENHNIKVVLKRQSLRSSHITRQEDMKILNVEDYFNTIGVLPKNGSEETKKLEKQLTGFDKVLNKNKFELNEAIPFKNEKNILDELPFNEFI